ncbi:DUF424 domain-containing protein [Candidatus Woesearchaeota archaeon CG08_land_8_20_14_0_20_47_9]|nr:MAG: hypothetical protein AUJ69_00440 [Candidatus Woesearchaeota archaeon CG1_02_47_18]PIO03162.1 MAG: DUF424 domain-containing protein [Candidatus Woesearchaeota archaeon CG08_land_8_20_14_0_20_47_9]HII29627.1 DUF424 family protein [Candidatus Woesearchaeota archaeon]
MLVVRKISYEHGIILVAADKELLGKRFEEAGLQLDLTSPFYEGAETAESELPSLLKKAYITHLVGKRAVEIAIREGIVDRRNVIEVEGIPHAETVCAEA